jgi:hypothetical protein
MSSKLKNDIAATYIKNDDKKIVTRILSSCRLAPTTPPYRQMRRPQPGARAPGRPHRLSMSPRSGLQTLVTLQSQELVEQLAEQSSHLEVANLLINGELPTKGQLDAFRDSITRHTMVNEQLLRFFQGT